jgi:glutamyl-tRNA synthetase
LIIYGKQFLYNKDSLFNWPLTASYIKEKIIKFSDIYNSISFLFNFVEYDIDIILHEKYKIDYISALKCLTNLFEIINLTENISIQSYENILRTYAADNNLKFGHVMWCFRIALSGLKNTIIGGFEIAEIIGKKEVLNRLQFSINILKSKAMI